MNALQQLATLLQPAVKLGGQQMTANNHIDTVLQEMKARAKSSHNAAPKSDRQLPAVKRFWESKSIENFEDTYLIAWGLCLPVRVNGPYILEDVERLKLVLDEVDSWRTNPIPYRRCYLGLVKNYFLASSAEPGWQLLRGYLATNNGAISDPKKTNPEWVATAIENQQLFSKNPCAPYVAQLLHGDKAGIERICELLGIDSASWFQRELILAQVQGATKLSDDKFTALMPRLLDLLTRNEVLRDRGLIFILNRYVKIPGGHLHKELRDVSVLSWGNPWLVSNETRWGGVDNAARTMVADWLKLEFIETFFTKLADDGVGDPRRMEFWKRYVKSVDNIQFALGSAARNSRDPDFVLLRKKMKGLLCALDAAGSNNAFIMTMGNLVAVEFSGTGSALYGYDARQGLLFDTGRLLASGVDESNSLKQRAHSKLWLRHRDGDHNWDKWEQLFEATLRSKFAIEPDQAKPAAVHIRATPPAARYETAPLFSGKQISVETPYSLTALHELAMTQGFKVENKTVSGGNLWIRSGLENLSNTRIFRHWGFTYLAGKGWWR